MATFMQKDVLIELISYVVAVTARDVKTSNHVKSTIQEFKIHELKSQEEKD